MYGSTVTVFCRSRGADGDEWYAAVIRGADLAVGASALARQYGPVPDGAALLSVATVPGCTSPTGAVQPSDCALAVRGCDKRWLPPEVWAAADPETKARTFTFACGDGDTFFVSGDRADILNGIGGTAGDLYAVMRRTVPDVYAAAAVSRFRLIPHFEVIGR